MPEFGNSNKVINRYQCLREVSYTYLYVWYTKIWKGD